jgi:Arc/MetJ-type ribon-helix-helix transcriptional regulator
MAVTLDPATEQRIQRKIEQGHFRDSAEVIARALDLLDEDETWSPKELDELNQHLSASLAAADRGELYTGEQARRILAERRAQRAG